MQSLENSASHDLSGKATGGCAPVKQGSMYIKKTKTKDPGNIDLSQEK